MNQVKQLFIMGNKRSGTSLLVKLLNLHPEVFVTHESDIIWIMYQARNGQPSDFRCYPLDGPWGMYATLKACYHILQFFNFGNSEVLTVAKTFFNVQRHLMKFGSMVQEPHNKTTLAWIGDKKPVQHCDPKLRLFMHEHFPNARYFHIVRDPRAAVASMIKAAKTWPQGGPKYWNKTPQDILDRWAIHEEWVLQSKSQENSPIHTLRFEDLCKEPVKNMAHVFEFLGMSMSRKIADQISVLVNTDPNRKYESCQLPILTRASRIMKIYGYHSR